MRPIHLAAAILLAAGLTIPAGTFSATAATNGCPPNGDFYGVAHQGAHDKVDGITTYRNTLPAFKRAQDRCQWVESDVRFTGDGVAVMVHDRSTYQMFRGRCDLVVSEHTLAEIQAACRNPDGSTVATFNEYLSLVSTRGFVEVKAGNVSRYKLRRLIASVYAAGDSGVVSLTHTDPVVLDRIAELDNDSDPISRMWKGALVAYPDEVARVCDYALYNIKKFTQANVDALKARGVHSISSSTSDTATWSRLASIGATGTLTDESLALFNWQNSRG